MKRGLLLIVIVLVAVFAWPAMTPGLFSGQGVGDAWRMAAEATHRIAYAPQVRLAWGRLRGLPHDAAMLIPDERQRFAEAVPAIQHRLAPYLADLSPLIFDDSDGSVTPRRVHSDVPYWRYWHRHHHHKPGVGAVPEPKTWLLLIGGFGMVGLAIRRRRAATATRQA